MASEHEPGRTWAYRPWAMLVVSLFIAYHGAVLLVHNLPYRGPAASLHRVFNGTLGAASYLEATANTQNWGMFAPNPALDNLFIRVLVEDELGELHDMEHDTYGRGSYPYLIYDPMRKVNSRLDERRAYRLAYGAWVCRDWERTHGGQPARSVRLVRLWTRIPAPGNEDGSMSYDPAALEHDERPLETIPCATAVHAQLPPRLRERYGLPPAPEGTFREAPSRTWASKERER